MADSLSSKIISWYLGDRELRGSRLHLAIVNACLKCRVLIDDRRNTILHLVLFCLPMLVCAITCILMLGSSYLPEAIRNYALFNYRLGISANLLNFSIAIFSIEGVLSFVFLSKLKSHPYLEIWYRPFCVTSGADAYAKYADQFTSSQIVFLRRLLHILVLNEYLFPYIISVFSLVYIIFVPFITDAIISPALYYLLNIHTLLAGFAIERFCYCITAFFIYITYYYVYIMQNLATSISKLCETMRKTRSSQLLSPRTLISKKMKQDALFERRQDWPIRNVEPEVANLIAQFVYLLRQIYLQNSFWKWIHALRFFNCTAISLSLLYIIFYGSIQLSLLIMLTISASNTLFYGAMGFLCARLLDQQIHKLTRGLNSLLSMRFSNATQLCLLLTLEMSTSFKSASIANLQAMSTSFFMQYLLEFVLHFLLLVSYIQQL